MGIMGTFIEVVDFENISNEHWKNGFVYKNIFYRYIKEESLIRTFEEYIHANNHNLYELKEDSINLKCFFTFVKVFGKVIIATPLANILKKEDDYVIHGKYKNIIFKQIMP